MCAPADMAVANDIKMLFVGIGMLYAAGRLLWTDVKRICWYDNKKIMHSILEILHSII